MPRNEEYTYLLTEPNGTGHIVRFSWGVSRARDTYGYNICTCYVDGDKVGSCNGGGYDMEGTALAPWLEKWVAANKPDAEFYGLSWRDPDWKPSEEVVKREESGESAGLERYQAFHAATSKTRTDRHTVPIIDGACGRDGIIRNCGMTMRRG